MLRATSEHGNGFSLDPSAQSGVEAGSGHDAGFVLQNLLDTILHIDPFDQTEPGVVGIEEKIDIAVLTNLLAGDGAEQKQVRDAGLPQLVLAGAKPGYDGLTVHVGYAG